MKKIIFPSLYLLLLTISSCTSNHDLFYNNIFLEIPNLVSIAPHSNTYTVGEKLYIQANFSKIQNSNGKTLDLYNSTGANSFNFSYIIEKLNTSSNLWETVLFNNNSLDIINGDGQFYYDAYFYGMCILNSTSQKYEYNVGVPLSSSGSYRLYFNYNGDIAKEVQLRSQSPDTRIFLNINSAINSIDSNGYYYFTVN